MTEHEILEAACRAMEELYGLRDGRGVLGRGQSALGSVQMPDMLHFSFTNAAGRRIHSHSILPPLQAHQLLRALPRLVTHASRDIVRQL